MAKIGGENVIEILDPEIGMRVGFFKEGRFIKDPDIDALICNIRASISEHEEAIKKLERMIRLCEHIKAFRNEPVPD
jgi:hypothetical protein